MNSLNVNGYFLKSTGIVAMKDITDDLKHTSSFSHVSILARFLPCHVSKKLAEDGFVGKKVQNFGGVSAI